MNIQGFLSEFDPKHLLTPFLSKIVFCYNLCLFLSNTKHPPCISKSPASATPGMIQSSLCNQASVQRHRLHQPWFHRSSKRCGNLRRIRHSSGSDAVEKGLHFRSLLKFGLPRISDVLDEGMRRHSCYSGAINGVDMLRRVSRGTGGLGEVSGSRLGEVVRSHSSPTRVDSDAMTD